MIENVVSNKLPDRRTYTLHTVSVLTFLGTFWTVGMFLWAGVVFVGLGLRYGFAIELVLAEFVLIGLGIYGFILTKRLSGSKELSVSDTGIEYEDKLARLTINSSWDNIERIELALDTSGYHLQLALREPVAVHMSTRQHVTARESTIIHGVGMWCTVLPLRTPLLNRANLLSDLRYYAPQLFEISPSN
jgi:hypothetical protein